MCGLISGCLLKQSGPPAVEDDPYDDGPYMLAGKKLRNPMLVGEHTMSAVTTSLTEGCSQVRAEIGRAKKSTYNLPGDDFVFGGRNVYNDGGAKEGEWGRYSSIPLAALNASSSLFSSEWLACEFSDKHLPEAPATKEQEFPSSEPQSSHQGHHIGGGHGSIQKGIQGKGGTKTERPACQKVLQCSQSSNWIWCSSVRVSAAQCWCLFTTVLTNLVVAALTRTWQT